MALLRPVRADFRPEWAKLRPEWAKLRPEFFLFDLKSEKPHQSWGSRIDNSFMRLLLKKIIKFSSAQESNYTFLCNKANTYKSRARFT